ncbi:hypothetical protein C7M84_002262 [Penaeus vannamei]|uniref:Uncharacterized protein n=1 Tax=Penaeus vannamei TaxID=6689 RepID=A0A3R7SWT3_PENVA|nr:hypothetical protein C7M84_002262 [Penaeus vannamei]
MALRPTGRHIRHLCLSLLYKPPSPLPARATEGLGFSEYQPYNLKLCQRRASRQRTVKYEFIPCRQNLDKRSTLPPRGARQRALSLSHVASHWPLLCARRPQPPQSYAQSKRLAPEDDLPDVPTKARFPSLRLVISLACKHRRKSGSRVPPPPPVREPQAKRPSPRPRLSDSASRLTVTSGMQVRSRLHDDLHHDAVLRCLGPWTCTDKRRFDIAALRSDNEDSVTLSDRCKHAASVCGAVCIVASAGLRNSSPYLAAHRASLPKEGPRARRNARRAPFIGSLPKPIKRPVKTTADSKHKIMIINPSHKPITGALYILPHFPPLPSLPRALSSSLPYFYFCLNPFLPLYFFFSPPLFFPHPSTLSPILPPLSLFLPPFSLSFLPFLPASPRTSVFKFTILRKNATLTDKLASGTLPPPPFGGGGFWPTCRGPSKKKKPPPPPYTPPRFVPAARVCRMVERVVEVVGRASGGIWSYCHIQATLMDFSIARPKLGSR